MALAKEWFRKLKKAEQDRAYRKANAEKLKLKDKKKYLKNKEARLKQVREYRQKNIDKIRAYDRSRNKRRRHTNAAYYRQKTIERRMSCRTPKWADPELLQFWYEVSKSPVFKEFHVDHIIPLRGTNVSGLNTPENIQLIPKSKNLSKKNKFCNEQYQQWRKNGEVESFLPI